MRALTAAAILLMAAAFPIQAQKNDSPKPAGTIAVADSGLLTFASGSDYLIVASGQELELYDVRSSADARDVVSFPLDHPPLALAATTDFALAAVDADSNDNALLVIAPDRYSKGGFGIVNVLDVPQGTRQIALSPNKKWGLAASDHSYVTMALSAANDIQISAPFDAGTTPITGAALTNDSALLIFQNSTRVSVIPLNTSNQAKPRSNALTLDQPAIAIAVSDDNQLGAVTQAGNRLTLFDPTTLKVIRTFALEDGPAADIRFLTSGDQRLLVLKIADRPALMVLDVSQPSADALPASLPVTDSARALASSGAKLAVSDADGVQLFALDALGS